MEIRACNSIRLPFFQAIQSRPYNRKGRCDGLGRKNCTISFPEPVLEGDKAKKIVEMVWKRYLDFTDAEMVALTHRKGTPWSVCYIPEQNVPIPDEVTALYYEKLVETVLKSHNS